MRGLTVDPEKVPAFRTPEPIVDDAPWIDVLDYHTAGEPFRIVTGGLPQVPGATVLEKRRFVRDAWDPVRKVLMWEPRGHFDMYGGLIVEPDRPSAACGVVFLHNEGTSTMCGHGTIALGTALVESGAVPVDGSVPRFGIDAPCGPLEVEVRVEASELDAAREGGRTPRVQEVAFLNVASFAAALDVTLEVPGFGEVRFDVGYGGAFYAILPAERLGVTLDPAGTANAIRAARAVTEAGRAALRDGGGAAERMGVQHPEGDLAFLYGTILTGPAEDASHWDRNLCVFAEGEVDRSPTGSGVSARLAVLAARGVIGVGEELAIESILGRRSVFRGRIVRTEAWEGRTAVIPEVRGAAFAVARSRLVLHREDELGRGFLVPR
mgnify:CR=1 FL=1